MFEGSLCILVEIQKNLKFFTGRNRGLEGPKSPGGDLLKVSNLLNARILYSLTCLAQVTLAPRASRGYLYSPQRVVMRHKWDNTCRVLDMLQGLTKKCFNSAPFFYFNNNFKNYSFSKLSVYCLKGEKQKHKETGQIWMNSQHKNLWGCCAFCTLYILL